MVAKVEFPIGKKLFHLFVNPGTWWCPTVDLELVQTTRNVINGTRHSVRKFQPGKRDHLFRFSTFFWEFSSGTNRRNVFHLLPNRKFRKFWLNGKRPMCIVRWPVGTKQNQALITSVSCIALYLLDRMTRRIRHFRHKRMASTQAEKRWQTNPAKTFEMCIYMLACYQNICTSCLSISLPSWSWNPSFSFKHDTIDHKRNIGECAPIGLAS